MNLNMMRLSPQLLPWRCRLGHTIRLNSVKRRWELPMDDNGAATIREGLKDCSRYEKRDAIGGL